jgi:hypothetical protein
MFTVVEDVEFLPGKIRKLVQLSPSFSSIDIAETSLTYILTTHSAARIHESTGEDQNADD